MDGFDIRSLARKGGFAAFLVIAALVAGKKDAILAKLHGAVPSAVSESESAKKLLDKVAPELVGEAVPVATPGVMTLPGLRKALKTTVKGKRDEEPAPEPPAGVLEKIFYDAPLGKSIAYVTPVKPGPKRPAIVWIHGGMAFGIDSSPWERAPRENDQSGSAFYKAGIAEMFPALRGSSQAPGTPECFLGEVDDILAAADFLAARPDVDPKRIYLGGHSTGAVLVLLAVESSRRFRTVFAFGPVADVRQYGSDGCLPQNAPESEWHPRAPLDFLHEIATPTFVIEGERGNAAVFPFMKKQVGKAPVTFVTVPGSDHFADLGPGCEVVAKAILADSGEQPSIAITPEAIRRAMDAH